MITLQQRQREIYRPARGGGRSKCRLGMIALAILGFIAMIYLFVVYKTFGQNTEEENVGTKDAYLRASRGGPPLSSLSPTSTLISSLSSPFSYISSFVLRLVRSKSRCSRVRDVLFTPAELARSRMIKDQWCDLAQFVYFDRMCDSFPGHPYFNRLGPITPTCKNPLESYGLNDSEKRVCGLDIMMAQGRDTEEKKLDLNGGNSEGGGEFNSCVIISVGSNNEWGFEEAIFDNTNCSIVTLDCYASCAIPARIASRTTFLPICLGMSDEEKWVVERKDHIPVQYGGEDGNSHNVSYAQMKRRFVTYATLLNMINLKHNPDYFKMDIEGYEYEVMETIIADEATMPLQISFEIHNHPGRVLSALVNTYHRGGYDMIDRHDNPYCSDCSEVVLAKTRCEDEPRLTLDEYCDVATGRHARHGRVRDLNFTVLLESSTNHPLFHECALYVTSYLTDNNISFIDDDSQTRNALQGTTEAFDYDDDDAAKDDDFDDIELKKNDDDDDDDGTRSSIVPSSSEYNSLEEEAAKEIKETKEEEEKEEGGRDDNDSDNDGANSAK